MRKNNLIWIGTGIIFVVAAISCVFALKVVNQKRQNLAAYYDRTAQSTSDPTQKLTFLIKSDALVPDSNKKINIAMAFFTQNQPTQAEYYLKFAPGDQGNTLLAEYYLLNSQAKAGKYINRINNPALKAELNTFYSVERDGEGSLPSSAQTDLGKLLAAINKADYASLKGAPLLKHLTDSLDYSQNQNTQTLAIGNYFINNGLPGIGLFALNVLEKKVGVTAPSASAKALALSALGKQKEAETQIIKAISIQPDNITYYQTGVNLARKASDQAEANFLSSQIRELQALQK